MHPLKICRHQISTALPLSTPRYLDSFLPSPIPGAAPLSRVGGCLVEMPHQSGTSTPLAGLLGTPGSTCSPPICRSPLTSLPHLIFESRIAHQHYSGSLGDSSGGHPHMTRPVGHKEACLSKALLPRGRRGQEKGKCRPKSLYEINGTLTSGKGQQLEVPETVSRQEWPAEQWAWVWQGLLRRWLSVVGHLS